MSKKITTKDFVDSANRAHNNRYGYGKSVYGSAKENIEIECFVHGYFWQTPNNHIYSKKGCPLCGMFSAGFKNQLTGEEFRSKAVRVWGSLYGLDRLGYTGNKNSITAFCHVPGHGYFEQRAGHFLSGHGCQKCSYGRGGRLNTKTQGWFEEEVFKVWGETYGIENFKYTGINVKGLVRCYEEGHGEWPVMPSNFLRGKGCPRCNSSKMEKIVRYFVRKNNIRFEEYKSFETCKNKYVLRFDFCFPDLKALLELDGKQHNEPVVFFGGVAALDYTRKCDAIKNQWALDNGWRLIRVAHTDFYNIEQILSKVLNIN